MSLKSLIEKMDSLSNTRAALNESEVSNPSNSLKATVRDVEVHYEPSGSSGGILKVLKSGEEIADGDYDRGAGLYFVNVPGKKGQKSFDSCKEIAEFFANNNLDEDTKETSAGRIHKAKPGGYGRQFDTDIEGNEVGTPLKQIVKRGRGRPRKDADPTGYVPKYDFAKALQGWMVGNLPKGGLPGKPGMKHKLKDWMERVESSKLTEGYIEEGRRGDVHALLQDLAANGDIREAERLMTKPTNPVEEYVGGVLMDYLDMVANENPNADESSLGTMLMRKVDDEFGDTLEEVSLDPSQVAAPQIKAPGAIQPAQQGGQGQLTQPTSTSPQTGAAIIDFKNAQDPLRAALQQAVKNKQVTVMATESKQVNESAMVDKLQSILKNYPHEHKLAQEGWGMHESLYQALCDYYWDEGRIPREHMYGDHQQLRVWVEECYNEDLQNLNENPLVGVALRGLATGAGAAMADRLLGDSMENTLDEMQNMVAEYDLGEGDANMDLSEGNYTNTNLNSAISAVRNTVTAANLAKLASWLEQNIKIDGGFRFDAQKNMAYAIQQALAGEDFSGGIRDVMAQIKQGLVRPTPGGLERDFDGYLQTYLNDLAKTAKQSVAEEQEVEESGLQAYLGKKKYGEEGMNALRKAGREGASKEKMAKIRAKYDKLDEEGIAEGSEDYQEIFQMNTKQGKVGAVVQYKDKSFGFIYGTQLDPRKFDRAREAQQALNVHHDKQGVAESRVDEKLNKSMTAGEIISDFVGSKNPKFKGKSKKERTKMALGAYYGMHPEKSKKKADEAKDPQMEAWARELDTLLNEGLTLTTSTGQPGGSDSVSVSATDEDAKTLMKLIQDAGLMKAQSGSMSLPAADNPAITIEPVSQDEVMGTLEPADDDSGDGAMSFLKRMLGARGEHGGHSHDQHGDYEQEEGEECGECGHADCQCDHAEVDEMHNQAASSGDATQDVLPEEEMEEGNLFTGNLAKARAAGKKEADLDGDGDMEKVKETSQAPQARVSNHTLYEPVTGPNGLKGQVPIDQPDEEALDQPAKMEGERCDECGGVMESDHKCGGADEGPGATGEKYGIEAFMAKEEKLDEWANSPGGKSADEAFLADLTFMTKTLSGGLNNIKQDQTTVPSARVKSEERNVETSMAELMRKLQNIN